MAITKAKKEEIVSVLSKIFKKADLLVFLGFRGLSVAKASELRRKLRKADASYVVAKKRLARLVLKQEGIDMPLVEGEAAFVCSSESPDSALAVAKELHTFTRMHKEASILGGVFSGQSVSVSGGKEWQLIDAGAVVRLAKIPPRDALVAQLLGVLQGPMQGLVGVLNGNQRKLVMTLQRIAENRT